MDSVWKPRLATADPFESSLQKDRVRLIALLHLQGTPQHDDQCPFLRKHGHESESLLILF